MIYPLVEQLAADGIPVTATCGVLGIARQPYYRRRQRPVAEAAWVQAHRLNALVDAHLDDPQFGYRHLANEARRAGWRMSRRTAWALCSQAGLISTAQMPQRQGEEPQAGTAGVR